MADTALLTSAFVMSVLSGLVPFVNAEVLVAGAAVAAPTALVAPVIVACFDGDLVWAVTRDELGVERVVSYRIVVAGEGAQ